MKKTLLFLSFCRIVCALPEGGSTALGEASLNSSSKLLEIQSSSNRTVLDWKTFSIAKDESARFIQPSASSAILNRVTGTLSSELLGTLLSNGKVYLINPNGIFIGADALIQTGGFIASTLPVSMEKFAVDGELLFQGDSTASIIHLGTIKTNNGEVALLAHHVKNEGVIDGGAVTVAACHEIRILPTGDGILQIRPDLKAEGVEQNGLIHSLQTKILADGAYALGVRQSPASEIVVTTEDGVVCIKSVGAPIELNGAITAPEITVSATQINIGKTANIAAKENISLTTEGGMVYQEGSLSAKELKIVIPKTEEPKLFFHLGHATAESVFVDVPRMVQDGPIFAKGNLELSIGDLYIGTVKATLEGKEIIVNAGESLFSSAKTTATDKICFTADRLTLAGAILECDGGEIFLGGGLQGNNPLIRNASKTHINGSTSIRADKGTVIVWSNDHTEHHGSIHAKDGFIEVSGKELVIDGKTEAKTVLFDPQNIVIALPLTGIYPQYDLIDPNFGSGTNFGQVVIPLSTGNIVVSKPNDNIGGTNSGSVYVYNGLTGAIVSVITGSHANDTISSNGIQLLTNGNFVIISPNWNGMAGATTWGDQTVGISGMVGNGNSFVGSNPGDQIGFSNNPSFLALPNGNYVIGSPNWKNGANAQAGAATWGNGSNGQFGIGGFGAVSAANSFTGTLAGDQVGLGSPIGVILLQNGNYVVQSGLIEINGHSNAGAVTWGDKNSGQFAAAAGGGYGAVSASNSIVGGSSGDKIGASGGTIPLNSANGNFVVGSNLWTDPSTGFPLVGAACWGDGATGKTATGYGAVTSLNSIVGSKNDDQVGAEIVPLTNGNYVVVSTNWANGAATIAGAATLGNGTNGTIVATAAFGLVTNANSIVGSNSNDNVGQAVALNNGNFVVFSGFWNGHIGAVSLADGTTGKFVVTNVYDAVGLANSITGSTAGDEVGGCFPLNTPHNNYAILSPQWQNGGATPFGAISVADGTTGLYVTGGIGAISGLNSIIGAQGNDNIGSSGILILQNGVVPTGNFVVLSPQWANGLNAGAGAATWVNGLTGQVGPPGGLGPVGIANSITGTQAGDNVGLQGLALTNGNFVVLSVLWANGGAATWGNGANGQLITLGYGAISGANSITGTQANDFVSANGGYALNNGDAVILSSNWTNGANMGAGAATWMSGTTGALFTGVYGDISTADSLTGSNPNDFVGDVVTILSTGDYIITSNSWPSSNAQGAATWASQTSGKDIYGNLGAISTADSIAGINANAGIGTIFEDTVNQTFIVPFPTDSSGRVVIGIYNPNQITYARGEAQTMSIVPAFITDTLNAGTNVILQANDDITITDPIIASGAAGSLTLAAGRSIFLNGNITTSNANLNVFANDNLVNGVVDAFRDPGAAVIQVGSGAIIDVGTGNLNMDLRLGTGKTNSTSGDITVDGQLLASGAGTITLFAEQNNINLGMGASIQSQNGAILFTAGVNITSPMAATIQSTGAGTTILVVDNLFPNAPSVGPGLFNIPGLTITSASNFVQLYAANYGVSTFPPSINNTPYVPLALETFNTYYNMGVSASPYHIFYKVNHPNPPPPTPGVPVVVTGNVFTPSEHRAFLIAISEGPQNWDETYLGGYLSFDPYAPAETHKNLIIVLPSLLKTGPLIMIKNPR